MPKSNSDEPSPAGRHRPSSGQQRGSYSNGCELIDLSAEIRAKAIDVRPQSVRSLDAVHVSTALVAGLREFLSYDVRQGVAAEEMGLVAVAVDRLLHRAHLIATTTDGPALRLAEATAGKGVKPLV